MKKRGGNVDEVLEAEVAEMRQLLRCAACNMRQKVSATRVSRNRSYYTVMNLLSVNTRPAESFSLSLTVLKTS